MAVVHRACNKQMDSSAGKTLCQFKGLRAILSVSGPSVFGMPYDGLEHAMHRLNQVLMGRGGKG